MSFARKTASDFFKDEEPSVETVKNEKDEEKIKNKKEDEKNEQIINENIPLKTTKDEVSLNHSKDKEQGADQNVTEALENSKFSGHAQYQPDTPLNLFPQLALTPEHAQLHQQQQQYIQQCQQYNEQYGIA